MTFNRQEVRNQSHTLQQSGKHLSTASIPQAEQTCPPGVPPAFPQTGFEGTTVKHQYFLGGYPTISRRFSHFLAQNYNFQIITKLQTSSFRPRHDPYVLPFLSKLSFAAPRVPGEGRGCSHCSGLSPARKLKLYHTPFPHQTSHFHYKPELFY